MSFGAIIGTVRNVTSVVVRDLKTRHSGHCVMNILFIVIIFIISFKCEKCYIKEVVLTRIYLTICDPS